MTQRPVPTEAEYEFVNRIMDFGEGLTLGNVDRSEFAALVFLGIHIAMRHTEWAAAWIAITSDTFIVAATAIAADDLVKDCPMAVTS